MITYHQMKNEQTKLMNNFPIAFAFSDEQFEEGMKQLGVTSPKELIRLPSGGFIRKTDSSKWTQTLVTLDKMSDDFMKDDKQMYDAFVYELGNHEYGYTYDPSDTLSIFGLDYKTLNDRERRIFIQAKNDYLSTFEG